MNLALTKGVQLKYQPPDPEAWGVVVVLGGGHGFSPELRLGGPHRPLPDSPCPPGWP